MSNRGTLRAPRCTAGRTLFLWPLLLVLTWPHALQAQNDERILLATCIGEPGSGDTHVSGVVTNSVTGSPITGARIEAVSSDGTVLTETHAQIGGEYRLCKLPSAPGLALRAVFGTNEGASVVIPASGPQFMNLTVSVSDPVTIMGTVLDNGTQQPMEGVWVALSGTRFSTVTNREGKFSFLDVPPGNHVLESNQIGYAFRADSLTLLRHALGLRIALSEQAIVLDPITVTGRRDRNALRDAEIAEYGSTFSSRFLGMTPSEVEEVRHMASSAIDLVARANMPQIRVYDNVPTVLRSIEVAQDRHEDPAPASRGRVAQDRHEDPAPASRGRPPRNAPRCSWTMFTFQTRPNTWSRSRRRTCLIGSSLPRSKREPAMDAWARAACC